MVRSRSLRIGVSRREHWEAVLARHRGSGLSIKAFCVRERVSYQSFFLWKRRFAGESADGKVTFAPVRVVAEEPTPAECGPIEIELPGGQRVHVRGRVDRQVLADVLAVLGDRAC
jgi:hypothetical protein